MGFTCSVCGEHHEGELRDVRLTLPDPVFRLHEDERARRAWVGEDSAVLQDAGRERFFVRGLLELPIRASDSYFGYGVWVEVVEDDFRLLGELWDDANGGANPPFAATLANELAPYSNTEGLPVSLQLREVELLPLVRLEDSDNPLVSDQRNGITDHAAHDLAAVLV